MSWFLKNYRSVNNKDLSRQLAVPLEFHSCPGLANAFEEGTLAKSVYREEGSGITGLESIAIGGVAERAERSAERTWVPWREWDSGCALWGSHKSRHLRCVHPASEGLAPLPPLLPIQLQAGVHYGRLHKKTEYLEAVPSS